MAAHPADAARRHAHHQRVVGHVAADHRAGADEGMGPTVVPQTMVQLAPSVAPRRTSVRRYSFLRGTARAGCARW
jgi:hypothetical protein